MSPKLEVHGLGTRKTGNEQTIQLSLSYNKDIFNLFGTEHNNSALARGGSSRLGNHLLSRFGLGPCRSCELFDLGDLGGGQTRE